MNTEIIMNFSNSEITISDTFYQRKKKIRETVLPLLQEVV